MPKVRKTKAVWSGEPPYPSQDDKDPSNPRDISSEIIEAGRGPGRSSWERNWLDYVEWYGRTCMC